MTTRASGLGRQQQQQQQDETTTTIPSSSNNVPPVVTRLERGDKLPVCLLFVGMAGSGKTSLLSQAQNSLDERQSRRRSSALADEAAAAKEQSLSKPKARPSDSQPQQLPQEEPKTTTKFVAAAGAASETTAVAAAAATISTAEADNDDNDTTANKRNNMSSRTNDVVVDDDDDDKQVNESEEEGDDDDHDDEDTEEDHEGDDPTNYYSVNLDPATINELPYDVNIDIRDTVNYKEVMKQHKLGPNGAIMTSLNLFCTKFDQVLQLLEQRTISSTTTTGTSSSENDNNDTTTTTCDYILVDTPGQIEAFTWSASGSIMSESLASAFPTILVFVVDTARCASSPNTFMSNMLYACSMLYRTRLPLVVCFNKIDVVSHQFCLEWMHDHEQFQQALDESPSASGFYGSLTRSLSLVLDEFYSNFANACGVSAVTGDGMDEFWTTVDKAATHDFCLDYIEDLKNRIEEQEAKARAIARCNIRRLQRDINGDDDDDNNNADREEE